MKKPHLALVLAMLMILTSSCTENVQKADSKKPEPKLAISSAFLDSQKELVVELSEFVDLSNISNKNFTVEVDKKAFGIAELNPIGAKQSNVKAQGYETLVKDTKVQFIYSPKEQGYTPKEDEVVYVLGDFNGFKKMDGYRMEFDQGQNLYRLTKDIGTDKDIKFNQSFNFLVEKENKKTFTLSKNLIIDPVLGKSAKQFQIILD